jgi:hypothetical protein
VISGARSSQVLLALTEQHDCGQIARITRFIAATYNGQHFPFDLFELRAPRRQHR